MKIFFSHFHRIRTLVIKEMQILLADSSARRMLVVPVILQIVLFPLAATMEVKNNTLGIYNEDAGPAAIELMQRFTAAKAFSQVVMIQSQSQFKQVVDNQEALLVVRFSPDFSRNLAAGRPALLSVIIDGRRSNSGQVAFGYIQDMVNSYLADINASQGRKAISRMEVRHWYNPNLDFVTFIVPSLIANILTIGTLIVTSLSVSREKEQGTFDQLLVSPLTPEMIMIGKAIPAMMVAAFQATMVTIAGIFLYQIHFQGSFLLFYGSMLIYVISLVGFGLLISSVCSTQQQAFLGVFCFMVPAMLLSGYTSPIDNMPVWLQYVTWINPVRHFMEISRGIFLKDAGIVSIAENCIPLVFISIFTLIASLWMFRRKNT